MAIRRTALLCSSLASTITLTLACNPLSLVTQRYATPCNANCDAVFGDNKRCVQGLQLVNDVARRSFSILRQLRARSLATPRNRSTSRVATGRDASDSTETVLMRRYETDAPGPVATGCATAFVVAQ